MILETIEPYLEVLNLMLALAIVFLGVKVSLKLKGALGKVWKYFLAAILLFGIHELFGVLKEFEVFEIDGLYALTEFIFISAFLVSTILFQKFFESISEKEEKWTKN